MMHLARTPSQWLHPQLRWMGQAIYIVVEYNVQYIVAEYKNDIKLLVKYSITMLNNFRLLNLINKCLLDQL